MGKFYGKIGYVSTEETNPGVYKEVSVEKPYFGDVRKHITRWDSGQQINDNISLNNEISIVADPYALQHYSNIRYVEYLGAKWKVTNISVEHPRLTLTIGGVYNGPEED